MRIIITSLLLVILSKFAVADIVKFETNNFSNRIKLTWSGTLQKIDPSSQLAYFSFKNGSKIEEFQLHITRIYSLTLDDQDRVDRPLPRTLQDLKTPLPADPRYAEQLELTNENFVGDEIPDKVKVRPDRKSSKLYLSGTIMYGDLQKMMLKARAENQKTEKFEISRSGLVKWIRGY
jgi:hypothetical protein